MKPILHWPPALGLATRRIFSRRVDLGDLPNPGRGKQYTMRVGKAIGPRRQRISAPGRPAPTRPAQRG
jgi:hypothetical protein